MTSRPTSISTCLLYTSEGNEKKLVALSETDIPSLKAALKELQSQIEFSKVVLSSEQTAGDKLLLIEG